MPLKANNKRLPTAIIIGIKQYQNGHVAGSTALINIRQIDKVNPIDIENIKNKAERP